MKYSNLNKLALLPLMMAMTSAYATTVTNTGVTNGAGGDDVLISAPNDVVITVNSDDGNLGEFRVIKAGDNQQGVVNQTLISSDWNENGGTAINTNLTVNGNTTTNGDLDVDGDINAGGTVSADHIDTNRITLNGVDLAQELARLNQNTPFALGKRIDKVEKRAYRGTAIALAAQHPVPNVGAGQAAVYGGAGYYEGESAGALGVVGVLPGGRMSISSALGVAGNSEFGARFGIGYVFGGK